MFRRVHAERRRQHQDQDDEDGGKKRVPLLQQHRCDHMEGVVVRIDPEQVEDPGYPQHPEGGKPGQEEERQDGQQVHDAFEGEDEFQDSGLPVRVRIEFVRSPDPEHVLQKEDDDREDLDAAEHGGI